jgi:hypothetical protein
LNSAWSTLEEIAVEAVLRRSDVIVLEADIETVGLDGRWFVGPWKAVLILSEDRLNRIASGR